jgi:transposase
MPSRPKLSDAQQQRLARVLREEPDITLAALAERFGLSIESIHVYRKRLAIEPRQPEKGRGAA